MKINKNLPNSKHRNRRLIGLNKNIKRKRRQNFNRKTVILQNSTVTNLSKYKLTNNEVIILNKGLSFIPSTFKLSFKEINKEILNYERLLQLHLFFKLHGNKSNNIHNKFEKNPKFWPPKLNPNITKYCDNLKQILYKLYRQKHMPNINIHEIKALRKLQSNTDIIIKKGDKGAGIVVMDLQDYKSKIETMLNDINTYTNCFQDKTLTIKEKSDDTIKNLYQKGYITKKQLSYFINFETKCPIFYGIPKIHKLNIPLRPIVSQINGPTSKLNELVDYYLSVAEKNIPYLLQDTTSFINLINQQHITDTTILVTLDVVSLYTNIPNEEGIKYVSEFYEETLNLWPTNNSFPKLISKNELQNLLHIIMFNTLFTFDNKYYEQNYGCTMGAKASVKYANIYMHKFLKNFIQQYKGYLPEFFARLVDDIFTLWNSSLESLLTFVDTLNKIHKTIKFELTYSYTEVNFLDTVVYKDRNLLKTKPYIKQTDKKQYLYRTSCHPQHIFKSIPYSQALRYRRIISDEELLNEELTKLKHLFSKRRYPDNQLTMFIEKVKQIPRQNTLQYKTKEQKCIEFKKFLKGSTFLPLVITYHPSLIKHKQHNFKHILHSTWKDFLKTDQIIENIFGDSQPQLVFKNYKTISNYLITTKVQNIRTTQIQYNTIIHNPVTQNLVTDHKCNHLRCNCCKFIIPYTAIKNKILRQTTIPNNETLTCDSHNIIYLINCNKCHIQYIGQTTRKLRERFTDHISNIKNKKTTSIAIHFRQPSHSIKNFNITPLQVATNTNKKQILLLEKYWIKKLKTQYPLGLNYYPIVYNKNKIPSSQ